MFAAILTLDDSAAPEQWGDPERLLAALAPLTPPERTGIHRGERLLAVQLRHRGHGDPDEPLPLVCPRSGRVILFWGRLDNRGELRAQLGMEEGGDAALVLAGYERWGRSLPEHLVGDFAFMAVDPREGSALLVRDPLGIKPLYYLNTGKALIVASSAAVFPTLGRDRPEPDPDWMARFLACTSKSHTTTGFSGVLKLPGSHLLGVANGATSEPRRYFEFRNDPPFALRHDERWVEAYRERLEEAITCRLDPDHPIGTEHSGGLDSSSIAAYLAHLLGNPGDRLHAFGYAFSEEEPDCILGTSLYAGIRHNHVITNRMFEDKNERIDEALRVLGYPEEHGNGSGHILFYRECQLRGIPTLHSGFGGDEVVTQSGHHLRHEMLDRGHYGPLFGILPGNPITRSLRWGKAVATRLPNSDHFGPILAVQERAQAGWFLRGEMVERLDLVADHLQRARYAAPYRRINEFALGRLGEAFVPTRLENCTSMAAAYGVDYRWPLLDVRLIQQYLDTPAIEKADRRMGRLLHRRAVAPVLGPKVAWKPEKSMGNLVGEVQGNLAKVVAQVRVAEARLHPALEPLIDRTLLRARIEAAEALGDSRVLEQVHAQLRTLLPLVWLDRWLHEGAATGGQG
ncbi:MAG: hypothetical protein COX57_01115 [Alphaproteobacteria bacterium CG_4_10_14_0_2_um_filter_63_37]|nr:MAG: hypothetical protein AUJ55_11100 [Proteobacteria bacterium CG1_02_64_396]PJA25920.1 MAG: hypothetical protein COX57_01115 [Alphaproteobacteria bacterium CG_4_10_14_0_2_um_filter_63_37]